MAIYKGRIRIHGIGTSISVSVEANNPNEAKKIVQSKYKLKSFVKQMSRDN